jgi:hypothetical protein
MCQRAHPYIFPASRFGFGSVGFMLKKRAPYLFAAEGTRKYPLVCFATYAPFCG